MAMTHDYLDLLDEKVGISPANSEEEFQAAGVIADLMAQHNVEPSIEEFSVPVLTGLTPALLAVLCLVGMVLAGVGVLPLTLVGLVLAAAPAVISILRLFGRAPRLSFGPRAQSQNVVAVHRASGPLVTKGSRTIVIAAHYDSPREDFLRSTPLAPYLPLASKLAVPCSFVVAVCALIQLLGFLPGPFRIVAWIVGILAAVPAVIPAVGSIAERTAPCTDGANDNKAAVAALLGILENVRPSGVAPKDRTAPAAEPAESEAPEAAAQDEGADATAAPAEEAPAAPAVAYEEETVVGVRHGAAVLRSLGVLPESCELDYVMPAPRPVMPTAPETAPMPVVAEGIDVMSAPAIETEDALATEPEVEPQDAFEGEPAATRPSAAEVIPALAERASSTFRSLKSKLSALSARLSAPAPESDAEPEPAAESEPALEAQPAAASATDGVEDAPAFEEAATDEVEETSVTLTDVSADKTAETTGVVGSAAEGMTREGLLSTGRFEIVMDDGSEGVGPKDSSGLSTLSEDLDPDATRPAAPVQRPDAPSDPEWGKTSFRPRLSSVARRASLFDLPDPSAGEVDPLATDPNAPRIRPSDATADPADRRAVPAIEPLETISAADAATTEHADTKRRSEKQKSSMRSFLGRLRGRAEERDARDDAGDQDEHPEGGNWRGGAAPRGGLRLVSDDAAAEGVTPTPDELRDAVLALGDDELIAHDIWFVALGGSSLDHAGMRSFLSHHRSDIRGCFIVNLDCIGAGRLVTLRNEGREETRRADRRMTRLLAGAAADLHVELGQEPYDWTDTDATPAMRSSLRAVTVMGVDEAGLPALSHTPDDVMENVSGDQAAQVAAIVTEMIRRS